MNLPVVALNVLVLVGIGLIVAVVRFRDSRSSRSGYEAAIDPPTSMRPNRPGHELAEVVTEWAQATGVLASEPSDDGSNETSRQREA